MQKLYRSSPRTKNVTFPSLKKYLWCRTKEPSVELAPGYMLADVHVLVPLGSIGWEVSYLTRDSAAWWAYCMPGVSELSESMEAKETMDGVFERLGETVWSLPLQETMRVAMR